MGERAVQLLAVVGNLDVVSWTYTDETGTLRTRSLTLEAADAMLPERAAYRNSPVSGGISFCRISALRDRQKPSFKLYSKTRKM